MVIPDDCCGSNRCCANTYAVVLPPMATTSPGAIFDGFLCDGVLQSGCPSATFIEQRLTQQRAGGDGAAVHTLQQTLVGQIGDIASGWSWAETPTL